MRERGSNPPQWPGFHHVVVGVADLDDALGLWVESLHFEVERRRHGADPELAKLWQLDASDIAAQAMLRTSNQSGAWLHLVQFTRPAQAVRAGADVFDLCPKNLDIHVHDLPRHVHRLQAMGVAFRTDTYIESTAPNGVTFREIHMPAHDHVNVVLLELPGHDVARTPHGVAGVSPLVCIVPSAAREKAFYADVLGLTMHSDNVLKGPDIERLIGLPAGAALDVSIWGREGMDQGGLEIVEYRGVDGRNLYPNARPPARGILHIVLEVEDLARWAAHLEKQVVPFATLADATTLLGAHRGLEFATPAGLRIELREYAKSTA